MGFKIGEMEIGENSPTFIIAELSANHMNDFDIAVKTIEAMAIIKGMLDKQPKLNSLIIVPDTLLYQWQTEISF